MRDNAARTGRTSARHAARTSRWIAGFLLNTAVLLSSALLAPASANAQEFENGDLKIAFINAYDPIWNDAGSGARIDGSFWRPTPGAGWYRVGHHAKQGHGFPTESTMVVKEKKAGVLMPPVDYKQIWTDAGSGASRDVSIWHPVCPSGFAALGDVASAGYTKPNLDEIRCISNNDLIAARIGGQIWNDGGSGASRDFAAWSVQAAPADTRSTFLSRGLFQGTGSYVRPSGSDARSISVPAATNGERAGLMSDNLLFAYTDVFEPIWDDAGSGGENDVAFFKPVPPPGFFALGSYAQNKHGEPTGAVVMVVKEKTAGALAAPLNYEPIWTDAGSGAYKNGAMWWPSCPPGYNALGLMATSGAKPSLDATRCVREDLTAPATVGGEIYNDRGSGAAKDFSAWGIKAFAAPPGEAYISPGTCLGNASHSKPVDTRARTLKMKLPVVPAPTALPVPTLSGYGQPSPFEQDSVTTEVYIPFTMVKDPAWTPVRMAKESPYYRLVRTDRFQLINHLHNTSKSPQTTAWEYSTALENSTSFTATVGVSLTVGYNQGGIGWSGSATVSASFAYKKQTAETTTTTIKVPITAAPNEAVAAYCVHSTFQLFRADGTAIGSQAETNAPTSHVVVAYPSLK